MITIQQKRVLSVAGHLPQDFQGKEILLGVLESQITKNQVMQIGLTWPLVLGETILPSIIGPITRFNAQGKEIPQRDKPKETHYRDMEFTRHEWHGKDRVEVTDCVWIPYQKYPRKNIPPPGLEIMVSQSSDGTVSLGVKSFKCSISNFNDIEHGINVFLESFGICNVYLRGQNPHAIPIVKNLNWEILPPGKYPWEVLKKAIIDNQLRLRPKTFAAVLNRFEKITALNPDFMGKGKGGYQGYVVFGFKAKNIFVLESQRVNNAIYILDENWKTLSQFTKAEILAGKKNIARIIHAPNWYPELLKHLK